MRGGTPTEWERCYDWPNCICYARLARFDEELDDESIIYSREDLAIIETLLFFALSCVSHRCPDREFRTRVTIELMKPWWNAQKQGREMTEEDFRRVGRGGPR